MLVPPYDVLLRALGTSREELDARSETVVPVKFLKFLLQRAIEGGEFNEIGYLAANPDVAEALRKKAVASARVHYVSHGYFECRRGATPDVDEAWYLKTNPDVVAAIRKKTVTSVIEHYLNIGVEEFRAPREAYQDECLRWKSAFARKPVVKG